jgi:hypothetical protein
VAAADGAFCLPLRVPDGYKTLETAIKRASDDGLLPSGLFIKRSGVICSVASFVDEQKRKLSGQIADYHQNLRAAEGDSSDDDEEEEEEEEGEEGEGKGEKEAAIDLDDASTSGEEDSTRPAHASPRGQPSTPPAVPRKSLPRRGRTPYLHKVREMTWWCIHSLSCMYRYTTVCTLM